MSSHHKIHRTEGLHVSWLLTGKRQARGTRRNSRALSCGKQALFVLVWFRKHEDITVLGAGFGISRATVCLPIASSAQVTGLQRQCAGAVMILCWCQSARHDGRSC
jgi:hypothetical protein